MTSSIEFRDRSKRAPGGEIRIFLGRPETKKQERALRAQRDLLQRLAARGEYDVLQAVKSGVVTPDTLERLVDEYGVRDYRAHLDLLSAAGLPSLGEHVDTWLATIEKKGTRRTYRLGLKYLLNHPTPHGELSERPWHDVGVHHVNDAQGRMRAKLARATVQTYTAAWSAFFDWAILRERGEAPDAGRPPAMQTNPVRDADVWLTVHPTRQRFLAHDEFDELLHVSAPYMRAQYAALVLTGMRSGEFRNLPPAHVHDTHVHIGPWGDWAPKGYPRSQRGVRDVPVHPERLRPLLEEYREEWAGDVTFFVNPRTGDPWGERAFRQQFYRDAQAAGLQTGTDADRGVTPHVTRHTFASWLAQQDVQLLKIAQLLGDTVETVVRYYAHLLPTDLDRTILRLFDGGVSHELTTASKNTPETRSHD